MNLLEMHVSPQGLLVVPQCLQQPPPPPAGGEVGVHVAVLSAVGNAKRMGVTVQVEVAVGVRVCVGASVLVGRAISVAREELADVGATFGGAGARVGAVAGALGVTQPAARTSATMVTMLQAFMMLCSYDPGQGPCPAP